MQRNQVIYLLLLGALGYFFSILSNLAVFDLIRFDFIFVITAYISETSYPGMALTVIYLFINDPLRGHELLLSPLVFAVTGLLLSMINLILPVFQQRPFALGRNLFLIILIVVDHFMRLRGNFDLQTLLITLILNLVLANLLIFIIEPLINQGSGGEFAL